MVLNKWFLGLILGTRTIATDIGMYLSDYLKGKGLFVSDLKKKYTYSERGANFDKVTYFYFIFLW